MASILCFANNNVLKPMQERNDSRISRYLNRELTVYLYIELLGSRRTDDENADLLSSVIVSIF